MEPSLKPLCMYLKKIDGLFSNEFNLQNLTLKHIQALLVIFQNLTINDIKYWTVCKIRKELTYNSPFDLAIWMYKFGLPQTVCESIILNRINFYRLERMFRFNMENSLTRNSSVRLAIELLCG